MKEIRYMISDTAKKVDVEPHVLRYWEDELELTIRRNEMGHRYYTPDDIILFKNIKELKEQGFQLKAIKMLLPELMKTKEVGIERLLDLREELNEKAEEDNSIKEKDGQLLVVEKKELSVADDKMARFQDILKNIVKDALQENNICVKKDLEHHVGDHIIKEIDYMIRVQDEREEERFRHIDETIRNYQKARQEVASSKKEKKRTFLRRKK